MRQIVKEAVTVALFIDEIENDIEYNRHDIPYTKLQLVRKVVRNFLRRMEQSGYNTLKDEYGETYYKRIQDHLDSDHYLRKGFHKSTAVYLTYVQMQIHDLLRGLKFDVGHGGYRRNINKVSYYKSTLEKLMN